MKKDKDKHPQAPQAEENTPKTDAGKPAENAAETAEVTPENEPGSAPADAKSGAEAELADMKDKYLRLYSEFDNFRRRTAKEKLDMKHEANKDLMLALLPVLDDLERAHKAMGTATDVKALKEGVELVFNKLYNTLSNKGLSAIDSVGQEFDTDKHDAITQIPAPSPELKGKVVDQVEKGYSLYDKVIRFAKVVLGA